MGSRNCGHFAADFCRRLGTPPIPAWITNLAAVGCDLASRIDEAVDKFQDSVPRKCCCSHDGGDGITFSLVMASSSSPDADDRGHTGVASSPGKPGEARERPVL